MTSRTPVKLFSRQAKGEASIHSPQARRPYSRSGEVSDSLSRRFSPITRARRFHPSATTTRCRRARHSFAHFGRHDSGSHTLGMWWLHGTPSVRLQGSMQLQAPLMSVSMHINPDMHVRHCNHGRSYWSRCQEVVLMILGGIDFPRHLMDR